MNKDEIDKLVVAISKDDYHEIIKMAGLKIEEIKDLEEYYFKNRGMIYTSIMNMIEKGDYAYFSTLKDRNIEIYIDLMKCSSKIDDIKSLISQHSKYNIRKQDLFYLIVATKDPEFIKQCVQSNKYEFDEEQLIELIALTEDRDFIIKYLNINCENDGKGVIEKTVNLAPGMTLGIEIESEGNKSKLLFSDASSVIFPKGWEVKKDFSIEKGVEIISPVLRENTEATESIYDVCRKLKTMRSNNFKLLRRAYTYRGRLFNFKRKLDEFG